MKYDNKTTKIVILLIVAMMFPHLQVGAEESASPCNKGLYAGFEGGTAFGASTFSSFGADKTRVGYIVGGFVGYQFNPVLSLELNAKWGNLQMSARDCCVDANYWLSADGKQYNAEVLGEEGDYYAHLKGSTYWQSYGLRLNVNVLGFVPSLKNSPWKLEISPQVSVLGPKTTYKRMEGGEKLCRLESDNWLWGYGGNLQAYYNCSKGLMLGIYSGMTFVKGGRLDALPKSNHKNNFVWESGVRIGWRFINY